MEQRLQCSVLDFENRCAGQELRPWPQTVHTKVQKTFQKRVTETLREQDCGEEEAFIRRKIQHYVFLDRREALRTLTRLREIGKGAPPRIWAATFAYLANRWSTGRNLGLKKRRCLLGCPDGDDSCEHYGVCRLVGSFLQWLSAMVFTGRGQVLNMKGSVVPNGPARCQQHQTRPLLDLSRAGALRSTPHHQRPQGLQVAGGGKRAARQSLDVLAGWADRSGPRSPTPAAATYAVDGGVRGASPRQ